MTQEHEERPGVISNMRRTLIFARRTGLLMIVSGIALAGAMLGLGRGYELAPVATLLVTAGAGMITGLGFAKAIQSKSEQPQAGQGE